MTISGVLSSSLIIPNVIYNLQDIYDIVQKNACQTSLSSSKDWKQVVRGFLSGRKVGGRVIVYYGDAKYSFS